MVHSPTRLTRSERFYHILLRAYPRAFRAEFGPEMALVFRDAYHAARARGTRSVWNLWRGILVDCATSACRLHVRSWLARAEPALAFMRKATFAMTTPLALEIGQRTDIGLVRPTNEDQLLAVVPDDQTVLQAKGALFVVADGMGGHKRGDVASALAVRQVEAAYYQSAQSNIPTALADAITQANAAIYQSVAAERAQGTPDFSMGATCVAAVLRDHTLYVANVGDSRVYVLRDGALRQITRDHSVVARMVERGEITPAAARMHELRNRIYRALGEATVEVDTFTEPVAEGDLVLLCTDGLSGVLDDDALCAIIQGNDPAASVQRLIAQANAAGGPDNVTAIVVRIAKE